MANEIRNHYIYILLSQTQTFPSKIIRLYTRKPYAHASIAFDERLDEMYSFARRGIWNPLNAGFIREDIDTGIFGRYVDTMCCIYRLKVTQEQYDNMRDIIERFKSDSMSYSYNFLGVAAIAFNKSLDREKKYFCSQFVAYVLKMSGIEVSEKTPGLVTPMDLAKYDELETVYVGRLHDYRKYVDKIEIPQIKAV